MNNRILQGWTVTRALYLLMGLLLGVQSIYEQQYFGLAFGCYFMAMGVFNFGCAAGGCYGNVCNTGKLQKANKKTVQPEFEEVKSN